MPSPEEIAGSHTDLPARELLALYDDLTALNACSAFVMQALAAALAGGGGLDERSATGAVFCAQWLNDCTVEVERQFKNIVSRVYASTTVGGLLFRGRPRGQNTVSDYISKNCVLTPSDRIIL